jgi:hypothetical protein
MNTDFKNVEMTADEKMQAVTNLKKTMEDNFVSMGQLLSEIKRTKLFKRKGYKKFKDFVENEFNMAGSFASKLIGIYELYIQKLDIDETSVKEIGLDKLNMIKPFVKDASYQESEEWIEKAENKPTVDLREEIKDLRKKKKEQEKTLQDIYVEQFFEKMLNFFNCSRKELNFNLALFFQDSDLDEMRSKINQRKRRFEKEQEPQV